MISIEEFKKISFDKKCDVVTIHSNYIAMHVDGPIKSYLYHTGAFFIEVAYSTAERRVTSIAAFNDMALLMPYTNTVSLADLKL
jgi:hypothetical protein